MIYMRITIISAQQLDCTLINGTKYLKLDKTVECFADVHLPAGLLSIGFVIGFVVFLPIYLYYTYKATAEEVKLAENIGKLEELPTSMKHYIRRFKPKYFWTAVLPIYVSLVIGTQSVFTTDASIRTVVPAFIILFHTVLILSTSPFRSALKMLKILGKNFLYLAVCGVLLGVMDGGDVAFFAFVPCMCVLLLWSGYQLYLHRVYERLDAQNKAERIDMNDPAFAKWARNVMKDDEDTDDEDSFDVVTMFNGNSIEVDDDDIVSPTKRSTKSDMALPKKSRNLPNSVFGGFMLKKRPDRVIIELSVDEVDIMSDLTSSEDDVFDEIFEGLDTQRGFNSD
jgi:hypothetical protein